MQYGNAPRGAGAAARLTLLHVISGGWRKYVFWLILAPALLEPLGIQRNGIWRFIPESEASMETDKLIRRRKVLELIGLSHSTQWRLERAGQFPSRVSGWGRWDGTWRRWRSGSGA